MLSKINSSKQNFSDLCVDIIMYYKDLNFFAQLYILMYSSI